MLISRPSRPETGSYPYYTRTTIIEACKRIHVVSCLLIYDIDALVLQHSWPSKSVRRLC